MFKLLALRSLDLSQAEKKVTVVKSEQMHKIQIFLRKMTKSLKYLEKI